MLTLQEQFLKYLTFTSTTSYARIEEPRYLQIVDQVLAGQNPPEAATHSFLIYGVLAAYGNAPPELRPLALKTLHNWPNTSETAHRVCWEWAKTRDPQLETLIAKRGWTITNGYSLYRVLVNLKFEHTGGFDLLPLWQQASEQINQLLLGYLLHTLKDKDPLIRANTRKAIGALSPYWLGVLAQIWVKQAQAQAQTHLSPSRLTKSQIEREVERAGAELDLEVARLIAQTGWVPPRPAMARVLVSLYAGKAKIIARGKPEIVPGLLRACESDDSQLREQARQAIHQLSRPETRAELFHQLIWQPREVPVAQQALLETGWLPHHPTDRALFLFVTRQWERYEQLDWDHQLLRLTYQTPQWGLRRRLVALVREAGRVQYLTPFTTQGDSREGSSTNLGLNRLNNQEAELVVQVLKSNQAWEKLWQQVSELPLHWSVQALKALRHSGWQPSTSAEEAELFELLVAQLDQITLTREQEVRPLLRLEGPTTTVGVKGRVNDLAFSPVAPHLAIGTGARQVVIWDYQAAQKVAVVGVKQAVNRLVYLPDGRLAIGEKSPSHRHPASLYVWDPNSKQVSELGQHTGSVTALAVAGQAKLLSAGRDGQLTLWEEGHPTFSQTLPNWVREIVVSPDYKQLALVTRRLHLLSGPLPGKVLTVPSGRVVVTAAFGPDGNRLLVGERRSEVYQLNLDNPLQLAGNRQSVAAKTLPCAGDWLSLTTLPELQSWACVYYERGQLHFLEESCQQVVNSLELGEPHITATGFSPSNFLLASGHADQQVRLWDLRPLAIQRVFGLPLAALRPPHLAALGSIQPDVPGPIPGALAYLEALTRYRWRYDIELEEGSTSFPLQPGEYDLEIE